MEKDSEQQQAKLRVEVASLQSQLQETSEERTSLQHSLDDIRSKHEVEMTALSGNLSLLRAAMEEQNQQLTSEQKVSNKLRGDIAGEVDCLSTLSYCRKLTDEIKISGETEAPVGQQAVS